MAGSDELLLSLADCKNGSLSEKQQFYSQKVILREINKIESSIDELLQQNFVRYVCGYLLKNLFKSTHAKFVLCTARNTLNWMTLFCFLKAYENRNRDTFVNLKMPNNVRLICRV